jgi:hypothetical protein
MIACALVMGVAQAQDAKPTIGSEGENPVEAPEADDASKAEAPKSESFEDGQKRAAAADKKVKQDLKKKEKIRVLKPEEVAGELLRLSTKADIKAELKIRTVAGRPLVFKGVIRNGKLIERIVDRRFVSQKNASHRRCGVRLWWSGNSDGYIFFRYSTIETVTITGKLTAKEREEILRRLRAAKNAGAEAQEEKKKAAASEAANMLDIEKLTETDREKWLMARFLTSKGWTSHRYRDLKRREILENLELSVEQAMFVKYFSVLEQARFRVLRTEPTKKEEFEPGSADAEKAEKVTQPGTKSDEPKSTEDD